MVLNELKLSFSTKKSLRFNCAFGCTEREQQDHRLWHILKRKRIFPAVFSILSSPPKRVMINGSFCLEKIKRAIKRKTNTNESPDWPNDEPPQARDTRESIITKCDLQNCSSGVKRLINAIVNHLRKDTRCVGAYTRARSAIYRPCPSSENRKREWQKVLVRCVSELIGGENGKPFSVWIAHLIDLCRN